MSKEKTEKCGYLLILKLAFPMMLSMLGHTVMSVVDAIFLARYSDQAVAAIGPAGTASWMIVSLFIGAAGYTATFTAQYKGAGMTERIGAAIWQGIYFALVTGLLILSFGVVFSHTVFDLSGHSAGVAQLEAAYFKISCIAAPATVLGSAISGFFTGRGAMKTVMFIQLAGQAANIFIDYILIFGRYGFPEMGVSGAALASLISQVIIAAVLFVAMLLPGNRKKYGTWKNRSLDIQLFRRFFTYGMPNGFRFFFESFAWTVFLFFIGRVGDTELAATSIAWRLNIFAFFPIIGLSVAVTTLVGQAQGRNDSSEAARCTWRGLAIGQAWIMLWSFIFIAMPGPLVSLFNPEGSEMTRLAVILLRYVAIYCLLDAVNMVILGALQGAGDTSWTMWAAFIVNALFLASLYILGSLGFGLHSYWIAGTASVMVSALVWLVRFFSGKWRSMRVIESHPEILPPVIVQ